MKFLTARGCRQIAEPRKICVFLFFLIAFLIRWYCVSDPKPKYLTKSTRVECNTNSKIRTFRLPGQLLKDCLIDT